MKNLVKGVGKGSRDLLFLNFGIPGHISGTVRARNFKFSMQIDHRGTDDKNEKVGQSGWKKGYVTYF